MMRTDRWVNIHRVLLALDAIGQGTSTELSKHVNLSRQSINKILQHAKLHGYCEFEEYQHRPNSIGRKWGVTKWWLANIDNHKNLVKMHDGVKLFQKQMFDTLD